MAILSFVAGWAFSFIFDVEFLFHMQFLKASVLANLKEPLVM